MAISTPVPILQHERELEWMLDLYRHEQPRSVLEIGVWHGGTLYHWLHQARQDVPVTVVAVDPFRDGNRQQFREWVPQNVTLHLVEGLSGDPAVVDWVRAISSRYDWVFIDADHHYPAVKSDWELYGPMGATVVFHDIGSDVNQDQEVPILWRELRAGHQISEYVVENNDGWGGIGVIHRTRLHSAAQKNGPGAAETAQGQDTGG